MEKIIDQIKQSLFDFNRFGRNRPSTVRMSYATFIMMMKELDNHTDVLCYCDNGKPYYQICGLDFVECNDLKQGYVQVLE